jgi:hypothetical protein
MAPRQRGLVLRRRLGCHQLMQIKHERLTTGFMPK